MDDQRNQAALPVLGEPSAKLPPMATKWSLFVRNNATEGKLLVAHLYATELK